MTEVTCCMTFCKHNLGKEDEVSGICKAKKVFIQHFAVGDDCCYCCSYVSKTEKK